MRYDEKREEKKRRERKKREEKRKEEKWRKVGSGESVSVCVCVCMYVCLYIPTCREGKKREKNCVKDDFEKCQVKNINFT